ncbi:Chloride channel protein D [Durusdinium trenchii]|uniref:Chloride channel protein D n=1 Tax=Durusdinium trenchii TaxID=1381693 RepID=A0ABP0QDS7_9DINO
MALELVELCEKSEEEPLAMSSAAASPACGEHHHHDHHIHGPLDRSKALGIGSLSFEPIFNEKYNANRVARETMGFLCLQRLLPILIGLLTAAAAVVVGYISELLGDLRTEKVNGLIVEHGMLVAWLAEFAMMSGLALAGGFLVYCGDISGTKTAGSSGIPQLIGLLNGCDLKGEFSLRHGLVKWFGVCLAVASGLAVGPEGPMIFIGASIGFFCSRLPQNPTVWRVLGTPPATVGDDVYTRDYTSIGAACGIAAAFRAPIAGTLFIVEEASSHFKKDQMANIFYGGLAAVEVMLLAGGAGSILEYKVQVGPGCSEIPDWTLVFCIVVGLLCGLLGAAFNALNIQVMVWRSKYCKPTMPHRRALELVILCALSSTGWLVAASFFGEREATSSALLPQSSGCIKDDLKNQLITGSQVEASTKGGPVQRLFPAPCLYGLQYNTACREVHQQAGSNSYAKRCVQAVNTSSMRARPDFQDYCCSFSDLNSLMSGDYQVPGNASCAMDLGKAAPSLTGGDGESFNSVGLLSLVPFKTACQNLFERGIPHAVTLEAMGVFLVIFFVLAALTAGSAIPSGLLMPQMVIGGLIGRMLALATLKLQSSQGQGSFWAEPYRVLFDEGLLPGDSSMVFGTLGLLDPGIGALIGAAAFLGGSGRVTLFTTIMMVEITGDPVMIFPVGFATIFAVLMGNMINHGLYHSLIDVQSTPYLPDTWQADQLPPGILVRDMRPQNPPIMVSLKRGREGIKKALKGNDFTGFPLVDEIEVLRDAKPDNTDDDFDGNHVVVVGMCDRKDLEELLESEDEITAERLKQCSNLYPVTVRDNFPLQSAYQLFKSMDMKNLVVVDDNHRPVAVMTRFAFLAWRVAERLPADRLEELQKRERQRHLLRSHSRRRTVAGPLVLEEGQQRLDDRATLTC